MKKIIMFLLAFIMLLPLPVSAKNTQLSINRNYLFDLDGNGKKETIRIVPFGTTDRFGNHTYDYLRVYINDKSCLTVNKKQPFYSVNAQLIKVKNKYFLFLYPESDNDDGVVEALYQYRSGKLRKIIDFNDIVKQAFHHYGKITSVKGSTVHYSVQIMSNAAASLVLTGKLKYQQGTLKNQSNFYTITQLSSKSASSPMTLNYNIKVYKTYKSKKVYKTLKKGQKVKCNQIYANKKESRLRLKVGNHYYWYKSPSQVSSSEGIFVGSYYAG